MYSNLNGTYYALLELSVINNNNNNNISETEAHNEHAQFFKLQGASKHSNIFFPISMHMMSVRMVIIPNIVILATPICHLSLLFARGGQSEES